MTEYEVAGLTGSWEDAYSNGKESQGGS